MKLGFIGLGIMGKPMAINLLKAGHEVLVFDIHQDNVDQVVAAGGIDGVSAKEIAAQCGIIITMLPNSPHVEAVLCGENGVLAGASSGTIVIDMSSIAPLASRSLCSRCKEQGVILLDAPVSGGEPKAIDGSLSIMVGGDSATFEQVKELLLVMGDSAVYCGESGAGNTAKLANQVVVALNIAAVAEAFTLAKKAGVDPTMVLKAIQGGLAGSTVMNAKVPMMIEGNFKPGFKIDLHIKDLNNVLDTGHEVGAPLPLTAAVMEMFQTVKNSGSGQEDHSALYKYYAMIDGCKAED